MTTLFVADLHLSEHTPEITSCFEHFLKTEAKQADALYILGDLFDFWVGDDDDTEFANHIRSILKAYTDTGVPCFFVKGNRDFLVGPKFIRDTGMSLLGDETVIDLYGQKAVVLHGDTLCTEDQGYLKFRKTVHKPWLQWLYRRLPLSIKRRLVAKVQNQTRSEKATKAMTIMDVTPSEVDQVMDQHNVSLMIHGHTHRPKIHSWDYSSDQRQRIVLGDWYSQGSILFFDQNNSSLKNKPFTTRQLAE